MAYKIKNKKAKEKKKVREIIISGQNVQRYLQLRKLGYKTKWSGEGKISLVKEIKKRKKK
ncbi:MAG TPA: hypothetical protein VMZ91_13520 [Candidatus Paceibacterota bacterium]|nr:hypothetical protein [Candidatus Paceibacterota bacterium]